MPFVPFADGVEVVLNFTLSGKPVKVVLNFKNSVVPTLTNMSQLATALIDYAISNWPTLFTPNVTLESITINDLTVVSGLTGTYTSGTSSNLPITGTHTGSEAPNQVAFVTTLRTAQRGRSFRGRNFWPGVPNSVIVDNIHVDPTWAAAVDAFTQGFITAVGGSGYYPVVASRVSGGVPRAAVLATAVTGVTVDNRIDTQRRRL